MILRDKAIKAAISVFICVLISNYFKLRYPFFVALPAIMPISFSVQETMKAGVNRMLGTIIGAAVGLAMAVLLPGNPLLSAIGIIVIVYLCNFIRWGSTASIAGLVFISIMLGIKGEEPLVYSIERIVNTFMGIMVTLIVNNLLFYVDLIKVAEKKIAVINSIINTYAESILCKNLNPVLPSLDEKLSDIHEHLDISEHEIILRTTSKEKLDKLRNMALLQAEIVQHLKIISKFENDFKISEKNYKKAAKFYNCQCYQNNSLSEKDIVFNYHLDAILELLPKLSQK